MFRKFSADKNTVHIISLSCNPVPPKKYGGIELIIANLCQGLRDLGLKINLYSPGELSISGVVHSKTLNQATPTIISGGNPNTEEHLKAVQEHLLQNTQWGDIILFNHADQFRFLKKRLGRRFFLKVNLFEVAHWLDAGIYKNVIYPSKSLANVIGKPGFHAPHGINLIFNNAETERSENLFFAGRLTKDKGLSIALEAVKKIGCKLVLAGPEHQTSFCNELINDSSVIYLGELSYQELFAEYQKSKAQIYLTQYVEPFGLSVIEAMAAGSPVITTGLGGTGDTVIHGKTGFHAKTVDEVVSAYHALNQISSQDCINQARNYSPENMAKAYFEIFTTRNHALKPGKNI